MFGYVEMSTEKSGRLAGIHVGKKVILRHVFCCVTIFYEKKGGTFLLRRRAVRAAKYLSSRGITRVIFPENFAFLEIFARQNIFPIDELPLYKALAAEITEAVMKKRGLCHETAVLAVYGIRMTSELERTVTGLCIRNRYVQLCAPDADDALCQHLRREYGVSPVRTDDIRDLREADLLLLFSPGRIPTKTTAGVLPFFPGADPPLRVEVHLGDRLLEKELPWNCCRAELFSALYEIGVFQPCQFEITGVSSGPKREETEEFFAGKTNQ